jgi:hypothetical protein
MDSETALDREASPSLSLESKKAMHRQLEKMLRSRTFMGTDTLRRLLQFLAERSISGGNTPLKEYEIATAVMGRRNDFDPRLDSAVRVQVARLRTKLTEYGASDGREDPYLVEVPRGSYKLKFTLNPGSSESQRTASERLAAEVAPTTESTKELHHAVTKPHQDGKARTPRWLLSASLILLLPCVWLAWSHGYVHFSRNEMPDPIMKEFWQPFLSDMQGPLAVLSNAPFAGNAVTGLYYDNSTPHSNGVHFYYTGVGEAMSIHILDTLFGHLGGSIRVQPGNLLTVQDITGSNLIFVGSPAENLMAKKFLTLNHLDFQEITAGPRTGQVVINNRQPQAGEPNVFMAARLPGEAQVDDYAVIAHVPIDARHDSLLAAGTTTIGTQAAINFLCQPESLKEIQKRIGPIGHDASFEVVLHVKVVEDVPLKSEIVMVRRE